MSKATTATSYAGALTSIVSSLTLTEIGIIVGITTALLTFGLNAIFAYRRDKRERLVAEATLDQLRGRRE